MRQHIQPLLRVAAPRRMHMNGAVERDYRPAVRGAAVPVLADDRAVHPQRAQHGMLPDKALSGLEVFPGDVACGCDLPTRHIFSSPPGAADRAPLRP